MLKPGLDYQRHRQQQLDRLADMVEEHLDTEWLLRLLQLPANGGTS
ncbi:MAG: hypothetical protein WD623_12135 [Marinobacter sp.]